MLVEKIDTQPKIQQSDSMPEGIGNLLSKVGQTIKERESINDRGFVELNAFLSIGKNAENSHIDIALGEFLQKQLVS